MEYFFRSALRAVNSAEIRPEVSGRITAVRFKDGQSVKAGEILFVIDQRPFEAAVARAQARIASANAALQFATAEQARNAALLKTHVIPERDYDQTDASPPPICWPRLTSKPQKSISTMPT
jgi:membrane fusion protein, multidrug efflux system